MMFFLSYFGCCHPQPESIQSKIRSIGGRPYRSGEYSVLKKDEGLGYQFPFSLKTKGL